MVMQNPKIKLGKKGVNYITNVIDNNGCNFHPFMQENDVGIDGIIEIFTNAGVPTAKLIAVQIKTGKAYYDNNKCWIPIGNHKKYWHNFSLPVVGIVCTVDKKENVNGAYWVDIKERLTDGSKSLNVKFLKSTKNSLNSNNFYYNFCSCFIPKKQAEELSFEKAKELISNDINKQLGFYTLAVKFSDRIETWKLLFEYYKMMDNELSLGFFYDSLTYTMAHPDHFYTKYRYQFSKESKRYVLEKVKYFEKEDIVKMLELCEDGIERGSIGESIDVLISHIDNFEEKLLQIISETSQNSVIDLGLIIIATHNKKFFETHSDMFYKMNDMITGYILDEYKLHNVFYPY